MHSFTRCSYRLGSISVDLMNFPNNRMHTNLRPAFQFRCHGFFGRWIVCQRPFPAAVGGPVRWANRSMSRFSAFIAVFAIGFAGCSDIMSSSHATRAAAEDTIQRGWIPAVLPASAVQIRESHNIDTNVGHGTFGFAASDAEQFRAALTLVPPDQPLRAHRVSRSEFEDRGYTFYQHKDFDMAIDWSRRIGEFWLVYSP
jgi:hypothetical protein